MDVSEEGSQTRSSWPISQSRTKPEVCIVFINQSKYCSLRTEFIRCLCTSIRMPWFYASARQASGYCRSAKVLSRAALAAELNGALTLQSSLGVRTCSTNVFYNTGTHKCLNATKLLQRCSLSWRLTTAYLAQSSADGPKNCRKCSIS